MLNEHDLFSISKSEVTILEKTSQGVKPVNCHIGAEDAIALKDLLIFTYFKPLDTLLYIY